MTLEKAVTNLAKGGVHGLASVTDPIGFLVASADYDLAGIGPADKKRGNDTFYNSVAKTMYKDYEESMELSDGYLPRLVGNVGGMGAGLGIGYYLWTAVNPVAALAVPAILGGYSLVKAIGRYAKEFREGEKSSENEWEKGSFLDGLKHGWHVGSSYLANTGQPIESFLTGRGFDNSHISGSTATHSAKGVRRNFASMAGSTVGIFLGALVNEATLGIQGIYKTVRDVIRTVEGRGPGKEYSPAYRYREEVSDGGLRTRVAFVR